MTELEWKCMGKSLCVRREEGPTGGAKPHTCRPTPVHAVRTKCLGIHRTRRCPQPQGATRAFDARGCGSGFQAVVDTPPQRPHVAWTKRCNTRAASSAGAAAAVDRQQARHVDDMSRASSGPMASCSAAE